MINFGKAPAILQHFGVPNKSMLMSQNKYDCSTNRKTIKGSIHNISDDVMKKLPELLANPLVIAEPTDNSIYDGNNRYVVTIDAIDNDNKPINVIVDYDWTGNKINIIPSVYGREEFDIYLENCIKQNKIIYTNKKVLTSRTRVQFPRGSKNSNNIITDKEDIINSIVKKFSNIHYQFIGKDGAKENSTLFNLYNTAIKMESAGSLPIQIKNATGWFKGIDGKWRYEISDADAKIINEQDLKFKGDDTLTFQKYNSELEYIV